MVAEFRVNVAVGASGWVLSVTPVNLFDNETLARYGRDE
jgi:hypothetical protein